MKTWHQLLVRHGWKLERKEETVFGFKNERLENLDFLIECLDKADVSYSFKEGELIFNSAPVTEEKWMEALHVEYRGRSERFWFRPGEEEPKVQELDTYISGIVRQFNRLGFYTRGCCDGHEERPAHVSVVKGKEIAPLIEIIRGIGIGPIDCQDRESHYHFRLPLKRNQLLDLAEKLSLIEESWLEEGEEFIKQQMFNQLLEELLSIPGESGKEGKVRAVVKERLTPYVDRITVDRNGNLLAEKTYKRGQGPTLLLSAHLDTIFEIEPERTLVKEDNIWSSSKGILGADDRAGVGILLQVAKNLSNSSFSGKVKYLFTVKEERGLIGAQQVDDYFLWGVDAAIVVDRRGEGDIVVSCGGYIPYCEEAYGKFFEDIAKQKGLAGWACTNGGSSDTKIWASHGIQSVNLSAGYGNEHSENEFLDVATCYKVTELLEGVFENGRELHRVLREIKRGNYCNQAF